MLERACLYNGAPQHLVQSAPEGNRQKFRQERESDQAGCGAQFRSYGAFAVSDTVRETGAQCIHNQLCNKKRSGNQGDLSQWDAVILMKFQKQQRRKIGGYCLCDESQVAGQQCFFIVLDHVDLLPASQYNRSISHSVKKSMRNLLFYYFRPFSSEVITSFRTGNWTLKTIGSNRRRRFLERWRRSGTQPGLSTAATRFIQCGSIRARLVFQCVRSRAYIENFSGKDLHRIAEMSGFAGQFYSAAFFLLHKSVFQEKMAYLKKCIPVSPLAPGRRIWYTGAMKDTTCPHLRTGRRS